MTDLTFDNGNNIGGTFLIRCVPIVGVSALPSPNSSLVVSGPPTFVTGYRWFDIYGTQNSKSYSEEEEEDSNGCVWDVSVGLFLPGDSPTIRASLAEMAAHRFIVECQDNCDVWRRLGTKIEHLQMKYKFSAGTSAGDRRGATISFSGQLTSAPPIVTGI